MTFVRNTLAWLVLVGNLAMLCALSVYVIRTPGSSALRVVPKGQLSLANTYLDTRAWTAADWELHPQLVERLREAGRTDILPDVPAEPQTAAIAPAPSASVAPAATILHAKTALPASPALPATAPAAAVPAGAAASGDDGAPAPHSIFDFGR